MTEECDGRRLPASPELLEEEERDNAYDKAGFLSRSWSTATSISGRLGIEWRLRPLRTRSTLAARACRLVQVCGLCPCTWVRCCLVFSVLFGGLLGDRE